MCVYNNNLEKINRIFVIKSPLIIKWYFSKKEKKYMYNI